MHEVVTLQFGQQSNYLGTHFWNIQESYFTYGADEESPVDHDIHFRPGVGVDGSETFTPRAVIYDLKGAFGTLQRENALYAAQDEPSSVAQQIWGGNTNIIRHESIPPSEYQQHLDLGLQPPALTTENVRFWSDYNRVFYHPRSIVHLHDYELNSSLMPFERWATGEELFGNLDREHDLLDRDLRPFLEECDQMQAIQIFTGTDDAWGGFAAKYLERIRDELGKTSAWVWGLEEGGRQSRDRQIMRGANIAQSIYNMSTQASMYIPLTSLPTGLPGYVRMDPTSKWHTSALQAAAIESIMLPTRLRQTQVGRSSFQEFENVLSNDGTRKITDLSLSVDTAEEHVFESNKPNDHRAPSNGHSNGSKSDDNEISKLDIELRPELPVTTGLNSRRPSSHHLFSQVQSLRGTWKSTLEIDDMNLASRNRFSQGPKLQSHQSSLLFPVMDSFPQIFSFEKNMDVKLAIQASLTASSAVANRLREVEGMARLLSIDEREALCDGLANVREEYEEGWESASDSGDDY